MAESDRNHAAAGALGIYLLSWVILPFLIWNFWGVALGAAHWLFIAEAAALTLCCAAILIVPITFMVLDIARDRKS